jgi:hypothetical protein
MAPVTSAHVMPAPTPFPSQGFFLRKIIKLAFASALKGKDF